MNYNYYEEYKDRELSRIKAHAEAYNKKLDRRMSVYKNIIKFILCSLIILLAIFLAGLRKSDKPYTKSTVTITSGQTLWEIAELYCPNDMDKREYIYNLQEDNDCTSTIRVGDVLTVRKYD